MRDVIKMKWTTDDLNFRSLESGSDDEFVIFGKSREECGMIRADDRLYIVQRIEWIPWDLADTRHTAFPVSSTGHECQAES